uniref:Complex I-B17 n=1 Tax=Globodera pallida TaxID=36090 RepID=A0A183BX70_GLOPA
MASSRLMTRRAFLSSSSGAMSAAAVPSKNIEPEILYGKSMARVRGFQTTMKPMLMTEWERTWERWRNDHVDWKLKLEKRPKIFRPTPFQRKLLVWTGIYESTEQIPVHVSMNAVKRSLNRRARFTFFSFGACAFIIWMLFGHWAPP